MAREDPTFTSGDMVRFWCNNLDKSEQRWVFLFFWTVVPGILLTNEEIEDIFGLLGDVIGGGLSKLAQLGIFIFLKTIRRWLNVTWTELIFANPNMRKEVIKCIDETLKTVN